MAIRNWSMFLKAHEDQDFEPSRFDLTAWMPSESLGKALMYGPPGATAFILWLTNQRPLTIVIWCSFAFAVSILVGHQISEWRERRCGAEPLTSEAMLASPLVIEFNLEADARWVEEQTCLAATQSVRRKYFDIHIFNSGLKVVNGVSVEVEKIEEIHGVNEITRTFPLGSKLLFQLNERPMVNLLSQGREQVPLI